MTSSRREISVYGGVGTRVFPFLSAVLRNVEVMESATL